MFLTPLAPETLGEKIRRQSCLKSKSVAGAEKKITGYQALNILFKPSFPAGRGNGTARLVDTYLTEIFYSRII